MVVQHNLVALNTNRMLGMTTAKKAKTSEKLSSGYRINRAADDAAGLQISEKMRKHIRGLNQGARNTQDGISFVQVGDGAMHEIHDMLQRLTELSVQAANGTNSDSDRLALDMEMQDLTASYSDTNTKLTLTYDGGKYAMTGQLSKLRSQTTSAVDTYMWWVEKEKINALINGTGTSDIDVANYKKDGWGTIKDIDITLKSATGEDIKLNYKYDYQYILGNAGIESQIEASFIDADLQNIPDEWLWDEPLNVYDAYYVAKGDGTYITTKDLYNQKRAENRSTISATYAPQIYTIENDNSLSSDEKTEQIAALKQKMEKEISDANSASKTDIKSSNRILDIQVKYGGYINSTNYPAKEYIMNNAIDKLQPMAGNQIAA